MKKTIILGLVVGLVLFLAFIEIASWDKIYPGVSVANIRLGGLSIPQAQERLGRAIEDFSQKEITLLYEAKEWKVSSRDLGVNFDLEKTLNKASKVNKSFYFSPLLQFKKSKALLFGYNLPLVVNLDEEKFNQFIKENLASIETPAKDASLKILEMEPEHIIRLVPSEEGFMVNKTLLKLELISNGQNLISNIQYLKLIKDWPGVENSEVANARMEAYRILASETNLKYEDQGWSVPQEEVVGWIEFVGRRTDAKHYAEQTQSENSFASVLRGTHEVGVSRQFSDLAVRLDTQKIKDFITPFASEINSEPINAELKIKNGKVAAFALSQNGKRLEIEESAQIIAEKIIADESATIELVVTTLTPEVTTESIDNLGITALVGKGESNFAGSPRNRIHNIKLGSAKFNGTLIKPDEIFSFNKILGEVGPNQGYLPELVIKRDKTTPEFGGGICQVSTTMFRAAIFSGLPIRERFPHAFPVAYYSPQGMDATVYSPHPDLKFKNDTPGHILIQRKIRGTKLSFEFFGTDDGREIKIKGPYITERKKDGSMKTVFYREFYRDEELVKKETFRSSYASPAKYPIE